jgi:hypothetical protein
MMWYVGNHRLASRHHTMERRKMARRRAEHRCAQPILRAYLTLPAEPKVAAESEPAGGDINQVHCHRHSKQLLHAQPTARNDR